MAAVVRILALVAVLSWAADATARTADDGTRQERSVELAKQGVALFKQGRYRQAMVEFMASYRLARIPEVAWNIARCHEELGEYDEAVRYFEEFEAISTDPGKKTAALAKIGELKKRLRTARHEAGTLVLDVPDGAPPVTGRVTVVVDGLAAFEGRLPAEITVEPGFHLVRVTGIEGYLPLAEKVDVAPGGRVEIELEPAGPPAEPGSSREADFEPLASRPRAAEKITRKNKEPTAAAWNDFHYADPILFPSSRTGFGVSLVFAPVFHRGGESAPALDVPERLGPTPIPRQTWAGARFTIGAGDDTTISLGWGRRPSIPWNRSHEPFQRAGLSIGLRTSSMPDSWSSFVLDVDYAHVEGLEVLKDQFLATTTELQHSLALSFGEAFGFRIASLVTIEVFVGLGYLVPDASLDAGWGGYASIVVPMAVRTSVEVTEGGHVGIEARWPVFIGPLKNSSTRVLGDMAVGYTHVLGAVRFFGAITFAVNRFGDHARETAGLVAGIDYSF